MNKKIFVGVITSLVLSGFLMARPVSANEGIVLLRGAGVGGSCYVASIYVDGMYRVLATCRDLKVALSPELNRYVVWINEESGKVRRLGEVVNGKMANATDVKFTSMFLTAESDGYGNKPSASVLLSGPVQAINFETIAVRPGENVLVAPTPTPSKTGAVTPTVAAKGDTSAVQQKTNQGIGGALSTVLKIALFGFGALLLIVGVFSFISRKRAL
jgi:hypothetical protein